MAPDRQERRCKRSDYGQEGDVAHVRLPSGEVRLVSLDYHATIGQIGNIEHEAITIGKAGKKRWLGIRPTVRGLAMNPVDHPHGGGEGKSGQGNPHPVTPWVNLLRVTVPGIAIIF